MGKTKDKTGRSALNKIGTIVRSWHLKDEALGRFLRENGVYLSELNAWKDQMRMGLESEKKIGNKSLAYYRKKVSKLEKELKEASAVIEAQKKVQRLVSSQVRKEKNTRKK